MPTITHRAATDLARGHEVVLWVEGEDSSLDVAMVRELLGPDVRVRPMGGCENAPAGLELVRRSDGAQSAGPASGHYAILDRDHRPGPEVRRAWDALMAGEANIAYWPRHEIENYLIEPAFVCQASAYLRPNVTPEVVADSLVQAAQQRVLLDCANLSIREARTYMRETKLRELRPNDGDFSEAGSARSALLGSQTLHDLAARQEGILTPAWFARRFDGYITELLGAGEPDPLRLELGRGAWLTRMCGKELLGAVLSDAHFRVPRADGTGHVAVKVARRVIAQDLMRRFNDLAYRPRDLVEVRDFFANGAKR